MHDHDELLIIDLLEDPSLSDEDIRARLEGCAECLAELEAQQSVMAMLDELPPATMTEAERHALRRQVGEELGSSNVVTLPGRRWDWTRLGAVAAAMLGIFVIGGVVASLGSGDDATGGPTTMVAASEESATRETEDFAADSAEALDDSATGDDGAGVAALSPRTDLVIDLGPTDSATLSSEVEALRVQIRSLADAGELAETNLEGVAEACLDEVADPSALRGALTATVDGTPVVVFFDSEGTPTAFSTTDCSPYPLP